VVRRPAAERLDNRVHGVPLEIDRLVAKLKLDAMGLEIDVLSEEQQRYQHSWSSGT
jgi:adenosylhomocysteinase